MTMFVQAEAARIDLLERFDSPLAGSFARCRLPG